MTTPDYPVDENLLAEAMARAQTWPDAAVCVARRTTAGDDGPDEDSGSKINAEILAYEAVLEQRGLSRLGKCCAGCKWWIDRACHVSPPAIIVKGIEAQAFWPPTARHDVCGEFKVNHEAAVRRGYYASGWPALTDGPASLAPHPAPAA